MKTIIIDASIVLTSLLKTNKNVGQKFKNILQQAQDSQHIIAPTFLMQEVANGLRFATKNKAIAQETFHKFLNLPINFQKLKPTQIEQALKLAYQVKDTVYDASYHTLALVLGGTFITADEKYFKKAQKIGNIELWR